MYGGGLVTLNNELRNCTRVTGSLDKTPSEVAPALPETISEGVRLPLFTVDDCHLTPKYNMPTAIATAEMAVICFLGVDNNIR